jgi:putative sterol carrier protein
MVELLINVEEAPMGAMFPSAEWLLDLEHKLNTDDRYGEIARTWEGDLFFFIEPTGNLTEQLTFYLDLWHGKCRGSEYAADPAKYPKPTFVLRATYHNITEILTGRQSPMTAMMTSRLKVHGNLGYMMRNVPTVLDFVRCASEVTTEIL